MHYIWIEDELYTFTNCWNAFSSFLSLEITRWTVT